MRQGTDLAGNRPVSSARGRTGKSHACVHQACALAALVALATLAARAQPPALGLPGGPAGQTAPMTAAAPLPASGGYPAAGPACASCAKGGSSCSSCDQCCATPAGDYPWEIYVRTGIVTLVGKGGIEEHLQSGCAIQLGFREPISCPRPALVLYANFGLGFARNQGDNEPVITSGTLIANVVPSALVQPLTDFYETRLDNLQRSQLYASLDGDYYPDRFNNPGERWVHLTWRAGARVTDVRAQYVQTPTPALQALIQQQFDAGDDPRFFGYKSDNNPSDMGFGLFVSAGAAVTFQDLILFGYGLSEITVGVEIEYGYDWFNLGSFAHKDQGLGTLVPMASLALGF